MQSYGAQLRAAMQTLRANDEQFQVFSRGLDAVLQQWTALQLVALHCDARAPAVLYEDLCAWHQRDGEVFVDDMEVYFEDFFDNVREVKIEDDSMKEVATVLHDMYCRCCLNDWSVAEHYQQTLPIYAQMNPVSMSVNGGTAEDLADDAEEGDDDGEEGEDVDNGGLDNEEEERAAAAGAGAGVAVAPFQPVPQVQQVPQQRRQQQQQTKAPKQQKKRKNASVRDKNGWNIVQ
jgi:pre-rRNA-processing protein TSR2